MFRGVGLKDYKRKNYLINPRFQIKVSIYLILCVVVCTIVYPIGIWQLFYLFAQAISEYDPAKMQILEEQKVEIFTLLSLWVIGTLSLAFVVCIFISHRIAGPLHKLKEYLKDLPNQKIVPKLIFRQGDYFSEIADIWNKSFGEIQSLSNLSGAVDEVIVQLEEIKTKSGNEVAGQLQIVIEKIKMLKK